MGDDQLDDTAQFPRDADRFASWLVRQAAAASSSLLALRSAVVPLYVLDVQGGPRCCEDVRVWAQWYEQATVNGSRVVARDQFVSSLFGQVTVQTIFLGMTVGVRAGFPLLFESRVFTAETRQGQTRPGQTRSLPEKTVQYANRKAARSGHERLVTHLRAARALS